MPVNLNKQRRFEFYLEHKGTKQNALKDVYVWYGSRRQLKRHAKQYFHHYLAHPHLYRLAIKEVKYNGSNK